jgi:hypothetical protein
MTSSELKVVAGEQAAPAAKGFGPLWCVHCEEEVSVAADLDDLETFRCVACAEEFTREDVVAWLDEQDGKVRAWRRVLAWLDTCPAAE